MEFLNLELFNTYQLSEPQTSNSPESGSGSSTSPSDAMMASAVQLSGTVAPNVATRAPLDAQEPPSSGPQRKLPACKQIAQGCDSI